MQKFISGNLANLFIRASLSHNYFSTLQFTKFIQKIYQVFRLAKVSTIQVFNINNYYKKNYIKILIEAEELEHKDYAKFLGIDACLEISKLK